MARGTPSRDLQRVEPYRLGSVVGMPNPPGAGGAATPPLVSVIVPAFQAEQFVLDTLRSVQAQTMTRWECIVVDDGSIDGTAELVARMVERDARFRLVRQANQGLSGARNTGLAHISPDAGLVAFLDADDLWCPDALERLSAAMATAPGHVVGVYGYAELVDEHGDRVSPGLHPDRQRDRLRMRGRLACAVPELEPVRFEEWVVGGPVWPPAVAVHRAQTAVRVGGFDAGLRQLEDWDFYTRMGREGEYVPIAEHVAWYRVHRGQMTRRRAEFWHSHDVVRRKTWESPLNNPEQRQAISSAWRRAHRRRIARCGQRLLTSVARLQWARALMLAKGLGVLALQSLQPGPPVANRSHVEWAGRDV